MSWKFNPFTGTLDYYETATGYIKADGTTTTTATIPFAEGIRVPEDKYIYFGSGTEMYIRANSNYLYFKADDGVYKNISFQSAFDGRMTFAGGSVNLTFFGGNATYEVSSISGSYAIEGNPSGDRYFDVSAAAGRNTNYQSTFIHTDTNSANAFVVENSAGTDVFRVNTVTPGVTISTLTGILKGTSGLVSVATSGTDYEAPLTFNSPLSRSVNTISLGTVDISSNTNLAATSPIVLTGDTLSFSVPGSDTQFIYNNAGALAGSSFFTLGTNNIPTVGDGNAQITSIGTCTISNASPCVVTKAGHGLAINDRVTFRTTGGLPAPLHPEDLVDGVREYYYIISAGFGVNSFQISLTRGGAAINTTTAGSGTQTLYKYVNYELDFNSNADVLLEWRQDPASTSQWTFSVRRSDDTYFQYPGYAARFAVNCTQVTDYESPVAFSAFINAGAATSELYGFWGGVYDSDAGGTTAFGVSNQAIGILCYNTMFGTTARTVTNLIGGDFTSELGSNISGTNIIAGRFQAIVTATSATYTNAYGVRVLNPGAGTLTNNFGLYIAQMTAGTNNHAAFLATAGQISFRAGTQAIWSPSASTLRTTSNTTHEWYIGANPSNATAGTLKLSLTTSALTFADAVNIVFNTTTGTKIGTATTQKLSLWNAAPIVQPTTAIAAATFVANTSGIANDTATWDGYTIGQVVKALRNIGALA